MIRVHPSANKKEDQWPVYPITIVKYMVPYIILPKSKEQHNLYTKPVGKKQQQSDQK